MKAVGFGCGNAILVTQDRFTKPNIMNFNEIAEIIPNGSESIIHFNKEKKEPIIVKEDISTIAAQLGIKQKPKTEYNEL